MMIRMKPALFVKSTDRTLLKKPLLNLALALALHQNSEGKCLKQGINT
jgi:hypothetical protein